MSEDKPDFDALYRLGSGDKKFVIELLEVFIRNSLESLEEMADCLKKKDYRCVADIAHRTSSSCKHLNALKLYSLLREIEDNARGEKVYEHLRELLKNATFEQKRFVKLIQEHIDLYEKG